MTIKKDPEINFRVFFIWQTSRKSKLFGFGAGV